ncbi:hypothetical protein OHA25_07095 [Nonomuraea sp. NBC_00507]|uniref:hypothetical protein n=1 Tax=Nonomuraea sp. NBC_00507 TaxID=2976002 RepID=UPI002E18B1AF
MRKILVTIGLVAVIAVGSVTPAFAVRDPIKCDPDSPPSECDMSWTGDPPPAED